MNNPNQCTWGVGVGEHGPHPVDAAVYDMLKWSVRTNSFGHACFILRCGLTHCTLQASNNDTATA